MKNIYKIIIISLVGIFIAVGCEKIEPNILPASDYFIAIDALKSDEAVLEKKTGKILVYCAAAKGNPVTVKFQVEDSSTSPSSYYQILESELYFPEGTGYDTIHVQTIDNDEESGNTYIWVTLTGNDAGYQMGMRKGPDHDTIVDASYKLEIFDNDD